LKDYKCELFELLKHNPLKNIINKWA